MEEKDNPLLSSSSHQRYAHLNASETPLYTHQIFDEDSGEGGPHGSENLRSSRRAVSQCSPRALPYLTLGPAWPTSPRNPAPRHAPPGIFTWSPKRTYGKLFSKTPGNALFQPPPTYGERVGNIG